MHDVLHMIQPQKVIYEPTGTAAINVGAHDGNINPVDHTAASPPQALHQVLAMSK